MTALRRQSHRPAAVCAAVALLLIAGCGWSSAPDSEIGTLRPVPGGTAVTVPALWAAQKSDGTYDGGIEPAEVIVSANAEESGYTVDLASIEARGAGPSWEAATASAAAFATLFSGADPSRLDVTFTITGPIDGPSAGGILTCGLLAVLSGIPFQPGVTMTGTITPDGSIGVVGYIPRKVQAAAEAGYSTVVIPAEAVRQDLRLDDGRTLAEYAESLGVELVPVQNVGEAFAALTGRPSFYPFEPLPELGAPVVSAATDAAGVAVDRLTQLLTTVPSGTEPATVELATEALDTASRDLAAGRLDSAYGVAAFGSARLTRAIAAAEIQSLIDTQGLEAARSAVVGSAEDLGRLARTELTRLAAVEPRGLEWQSSTPILLSWPVFSLVAASSGAASARTAVSPMALIEIARLVAEERRALTEGLPDAEGILEASPESRLSQDAIGTLHAYSGLFEEAARANDRYARDVLGKEGPDREFADHGISAELAELNRMSPELLAAPETEFGRAATRTAVAMSAMWLSAADVAAVQAYGTQQDEVADTRSAWASEAQDAAVESASGTVASLATLLAADGVQPAMPVWSTRWSTAMARAYRGTPWAAEANWFAVGEMWFDAMQLLMLRVMAGQLGKEAEKAAGSPRPLTTELSTVSPTPAGPTATGAARAG